MINTAYQYDPVRGGLWGFGRAAQANEEWHTHRTRYLQHVWGPSAFSDLVPRGEHPQWVMSPRGGLVHLVEFVTWSYVPLRGGGSEQIIYWLVCGQLRDHTRCRPVVNPQEVCHRCHDRHWLKTGVHLPALPQSGCELSGGTFFVSERTVQIRARTMEGAVR